MHIVQWHTNMRCINVSAYNVHDPNGDDPCRTSVFLKRAHTVQSISVDSIRHTQCACACWIVESETISCTRNTNCIYYLVRCDVWFRFGALWFRCMVVSLCLFNSVSFRSNVLHSLKSVKLVSTFMAVHICLINLRNLNRFCIIFFFSSSFFGRLHCPHTKVHCYSSIWQMDCDAVYIIWTL